MPDMQFAICIGNVWYLKPWLNSQPLSTLYECSKWLRLDANYGLSDPP